MPERISFFGPVQGMVRLNNAKPSGNREGTVLASVIKQKGCAGCPRLNARPTNDKPSSFPCKGVNWIGLDNGYLYEHQGHPVHAGGGNKCQLVEKHLDVQEWLVHPQPKRVKH